MRLKYIIILILIFSFSQKCFSFHIVGGELFYTNLGGNNFQLTLKIYRDCSSIEGAPFDDPLVLYIYNASAELLDSVVIDYPGSTLIDPLLTNPCMTNPPDICVEEAIYITIINLPPSIGGYDLVYQRCCRNSSIVNLEVPDNTGATYWEHIPDPADLVNSSPRFNEFPPIVICGNFPLIFDHSATDPDGDELVYEFYSPFQGGSSGDPTPKPAPAPPFSTVNYQFGFSELYPMDASPPLSIDPSTGLLTGTPTSFGQYVVGISVKEYRDGVLIGIHRRDFQFNVTDCEPAITAAMPNEINNCSDLTIEFTNESFGTTDFFWDFGVDGISTDTSSEFEPTFTYPDTGTYIVMLIAFPGETCSDTTYATVQIYPQLIADYFYEIACASEEIDFIDHSTSDFGTITEWSWDFGDGGISDLQNPMHLFDPGGVYTVELQVKNSVGCTEKYEQQVLVYPLPEVDFDISNNCLNELAVFTNTSTLDSFFYISQYTWIFDETIIGTESYSTYFFDTPGIYPVTLVIETNVSCIDSITRYVSISPDVIADISEDTSVCVFDSIQLFAKSGITFLWSPNTNISSNTVFNPIVFPNISTTYQCIISDACSSDTAFVFVEVLPSPEINATPADTTIFIGEPVVLNADGGLYYGWWPPVYISDPYIYNPTVSPEVSMEYIVHATGENGCDNYDTVRIRTIPLCNDFEVPNAFSPNGDGLNDVFRVVTSGDHHLAGFTIWDRWGEIVFESNNIFNGWDGRSNGKDQEVGVYFFRITVECDQHFETKSGTITLLR